MQGHTYTFGSAWKALNDLKKRMKEVASAVTSSKQACDEPMTQEQCDTTKTSKAHKNGIMFSGPSQNQSYEPCGGLFDDFTSRVHHAGSYFYIRAKFRVLVEYGVFLSLFQN
jgi:hypothetical protein